MEIVKTIVLILEVICSVVLIAVVLFQSGKEAGLSGAISGGNGSSYMGKGKSKSLDAKLASATKWVAAAFVVLTIASLALIAISDKAPAVTEPPVAGDAIVETVGEGADVETVGEDAGTETEAVEPTGESETDASQGAEG